MGDIKVKIMCLSVLTTVRTTTSKSVYAYGEQLLENASQILRLSWKCFGLEAGFKLRFQRRNTMGCMSLIRKNLNEKWDHQKQSHNKSILQTFELLD